MCYTSGTTGNPKGVLYSHRSNVLHAFMASHAGRQGHLVARRGAAGGADVPRQRLVACVLDPDGRRDAGPAGRQARRRRRSTNCSTTYKVTFTAAVPTVWLMLLQHLEATGGQAAAPQARRDRRLGLPARHDAGLPGQVRRRGHPRLGHDRDEPARLALHDQAGIRGARGRGQARRADEAGPSAVRRRDEDHRRRRQAAAVGRQDLRPPQGARTCGGAPLFQGRQRHSRRRRLLRHRRCRDHRPATATCRSPTAPRT